MVTTKIICIFYRVERGWRTMNQQITRPQLCILFRSGVQIWGDVERIEPLRKEISGKEFKSHKFFGYEGRAFNTADLEGIFKPEDLESLVKRKNGRWQCQNGTWHDRFAKCECINQETRSAVQTLEEKIKNCGECKGGYKSFRNSEGVWEEKKCVCIS